MRKNKEKTIKKDRRNYLKPTSYDKLSNKIKQLKWMLTD